MFKNANLSPQWLQIKISMSLFFYLFTLAINLWHRKFVTADVTAVFVNDQHDNKVTRTRFWHKVCIWRGTQQRGWQTNFLRKAGQRMMLISCSKSCGTQAQLTAGQVVVSRSARTEENAKLLLQTFWQSATDVLPIVRWSDREHLFVCKENKVSSILRELLKQKLSALHASSTVRVCQLLCTAPLETFQMQVLK